MNKKFAALLIPLLMLPMVSFAAAHWYDSILKQYKLKAGTVCVEITKWHVMGTTSYDANCNEEIFGDELIIENVWGEQCCEEDIEKKVVGLQILADPIFPCWELTLEMFIHNKGSLSIKMDFPTVKFAGPFELDPCWDPIVDSMEIPDYFQYWTKAYIWRQDIGEWVEVEPTTFVLKPCQVVRIVQYIHFIGQEYPELQCHWFRLDVEYPFFEYVPLEPIECYGWEKEEPPA
jgi:hypothetical protein